MAEITPLSSGINLVPEQSSSPKPVHKAVKFGIVISRYLLIVVGISVGVLLAVKFVLYSSLSNSIASINQSLAIVEENKQFSEDFLQLQEYVQTVEATLRNLESQSRFFGHLEQVIPQPITIYSLDITQDEMKISGRTPQYVAVNDLVTQLTASEYFSNIQIVSLGRPENREGQSLVDFTLEVDLN